MEASVRAVWIIKEVINGEGTPPGPSEPKTRRGGGYPPLPLVSLSGAKSFGIFGLQVVVAFTRLILNGLRVKVGKHWGYGRS